MKTHDFWAGQEGVDYIDRNTSPNLLASNLVLFAGILDRFQIHPSSIFEFGANIGLNLDALRLLLPQATLKCVEINPRAHRELIKKNYSAHLGDIESFATNETFDLVFTKGVLIHIDPSNLLSVYKKMIQFSSRYILLAEYFSRTPTDLRYHGKENVLFKRDFAAEIIELDSTLEVVGSGFSSRLSVFPQDDINWYLLEKKK